MCNATATTIWSLAKTFTSDYTYAGKTDPVVYEVRQYTPTHRPRICLHRRPVFPSASASTSTPPDNADPSEHTRIACTVQAGSDSKITSIVFVALRPLVAYMMRRQLRKQLQKLRGQLETAE